MSPTLILVFVLQLASMAMSAFHFVSIGDWGCMPMGGYHAKDEVIVGKQFAKTAEHIGAKFVLNTGDNFYHCGVHNKSDPVFRSTFEDIFSEPSMMVPWYGCLGNHDYGFPGSAEAQIEYVSPKDNRWKIPDRHYYRRLVFPEVNISLVVLDSSPCQSEYTNDDPAHWDPCGTKTHKCPGCTFHQNVIKQSCKKQHEWFVKTLPSIPDDDWKIVMTHAPAGSLDNEDFLTEIQKKGFDLYINGHIHLLAHYQMNKVGTFVTTGAGCWVRVPGAAAGEARLPAARAGAGSCTGKTKHECSIVFEQTIAGYTTHKFSDDFNELETFFHDYSGKLLHTAKTVKSKKQL